MASHSDSRPRASRWWYALLLPPYIALLLPAIFARSSPAIRGIPFFYWWQFLWIGLTALLTAVVYWRTAGRN